MPLTMPTGCANAFRQHGGIDDIVLLDIQTIDGTIYYFSETAGVFPMRVGAGGNATYLPWVEPEMTLQRTRTLRSNLGTIALQNLSGNSIDRDLANALITHEFEGAFCILRFWDPLLAAALEEYSGFLSDQQPDEERGSFSLTTLIDAAQVDGLEINYESTCAWAPRFKLDARCGSAGSAASCDGTFSACAAGTRAATERFNGVPVPPPQPLVKIADGPRLPDLIPGPSERVKLWAR